MTGYYYQPRPPSVISLGMAAIFATLGLVLFAIRPSVTTAAPYGAEPSATAADLDEATPCP